jgi:hypothetical protein
MTTVYCRHVRTNGERCCAFAMRGQPHCFFHSHLNTRHGLLARRSAAEAEPAILTPLKDHGIHQNEPRETQLLATPDSELALDLPALEDRDSIQVALSMLVTALGANRIDPRRASAILYGLQVASANAAHLKPADWRKLVVDAVPQPDGQLLALDADPDHLDPGEIDNYRKWLAETDPAAA